MSIALDDFVRAVETIAPKSLAYEWDNTGTLLRFADQISSVLITLDVTGAVIDEAEKLGCDMILSHHPLLFEPIKSLGCNKASEALLMRLVKSGISLYSAHTSFDRAKGGMGDILAKKLKLEKIETVPDLGEDLMRTGYLIEPLNKDQFVTYVKSALGVEIVHVSLKCADIVDKVAVIGGSGGDFIEAAKMEGAKALVTGEAKLHHFIEADETLVFLIAAGHYETERYFIEEVFISLQSHLNELQSNLRLFKAESANAPYEYI